MDNLNLEIAKEVVRVYHKTKDYRQAYKEVTEMYKKVQSPATKQGKEHIKTINDIIPLGSDIDNNKHY